MIAETVTSVLGLIVPTPGAAIAIAAIMLLLFAPRTAASLCRTAGRLVSRSLRPKARGKTGEIIQPRRPRVAPRAGQSAPIHAEPRKARGGQVWAVVTLVGLSTAVLLWWLLRPR